jgi:nucleoside-diphosphate-sugar epimerase
MSRIVIIGGSGHVGSYLVPRLVELGCGVVNVSRGTAKPYRPHHAWSKIENVTLDRAELVRLGEQAVRLHAEAKRIFHALRARGDSAKDAHFAIGEAAHACFAEHIATFTTFGV